MKGLIAALVFLVVVAVFTCCARRIYVPVERTRTVETVRVDTVIDVQLEKEVITKKTRDTSLTAQTRYAEATSYWNGKTETLSLTLKNKDVKVPTKSEVIRITVRDSIPYPVEVKVPVEVSYTAWYHKILTPLGITFIVMIIIGIIMWRWGM